MVPPVRLERTLPKETDFESVASTNSATGAIAVKRAELAFTARANQLACGSKIVLAAASGVPVEIWRMTSGMSIEVGQAVMQGASWQK